MPTAKNRRRMDDRRIARLTLIAFLLVVLVGGTNFVAARFSNRELAPLWGAALRLSAASLVLFAVVAIQRLPLPRGRALTGAVLYGLLGFAVAYGFAYQGLRHVPGGMAAMVLASTPLLTFGLALLHRQEPFRWQPLLGGAVALAGIVFMSRASLGEAAALSGAVPITSLLALVVTAAAAGESSIIVKSFPKSHPVSTNAVGMMVGGVVLAGASVAGNEPRVLPAQTSTWVALLYLILLGSSLMFVVFLFVLKHWPASSVSYQFVLFPVVAVALSAWLERLPVSSSLLLGGAIVLGGVYLGAVSKMPFTRAAHRLGSEPCLTCAE